MNNIFMKSIYTFKICFVVFLILFSNKDMFAQSKGTMLIVVSADSKIFIDGFDEGNALKDKPLKFDVTPGEHYVQAISTVNKSAVIDDIVVIEADKQKVIKLDIPINTEQKDQNSTSIVVADLGFVIQGSVSVGSWMTEHPNMEYPNYPNYYYAFEKGDIITIDFSMKNAKGTNSIVVSTFPGKEIKYSNTSFSELKSVEISVTERSIYRFSLSTNHAFNRNCRMVISRKPGSPDSKNFNTNVARKMRYIPVEIQPFQNYFVNSGTHLGGTTRELVKVDVPRNTVHWYYRISSWRKERNLENESKQFRLLANLSKVIDETGGVAFAITQLTQPPAGDYCDVYLLDKTNAQLFINKQEGVRHYDEGTRINFNSGIVQIKQWPIGALYIGIKNPSPTYGINVDIEVVAIVREQYLEIEP